MEELYLSYWYSSDLIMTLLRSNINIGYYKIERGGKKKKLDLVWAMWVPSRWSRPSSLACLQLVHVWKTSSNFKLSGMQWCHMLTLWGPQHRSADLHIGYIRLDGTLHLWGHTSKVVLKLKVDKICLMFV